MPKFVTNFIKANWSFAITRFPYCGDARQLETVPDFTAMAINMLLQAAADGKLKKPFLYLEDFFIDVTNLVAYQNWSLYAYVEYKLIRTSNNDRSRSRLSDRKQFEFTLMFRNASSFFARERGEFAMNWARNYNGGWNNFPTVW